MKFDLNKVKNWNDLKIAKHNFFEIEVKQLKETLAKAPKDEKAQLGKELNALIAKAESMFEQKTKELKAIEIETKIASEWVDLSIPLSQIGIVHPLTLVADRFRSYLLQNSFCEVVGSEIELDKYNFEHLNIAKDHPARDMQDSLYFTSEQLLRTHNTGFTARELEKNHNRAFRQFAIGKVYRNDEDDQTHSHQFSQVDIVAVGDYSVIDLVSTLKGLISYVLEEEIELRLRPSYFPFTEPSVEVDIFYQNRWVEVLGAGMVHQDVLKKAGYTNGMNAYAAGVGVERIAMIKYGVSDIREFYVNDLRFLKSFIGVY